MTASPPPTGSSLPPSERLYWTRPQDRHFTALVLAAAADRVALDRTLFYPQGGGQEPDAGTLSWAGGSAAVTDVQKDEAGVIWHTLGGELPPVGAAVRGELDWARRYRHSQRHSGEHLLAQAFARVNPAFAVRAVSMRGPECTLDLAGNPTEADAHAAETLLMERLRGDLVLETQLVPAPELDRFPLRRPPQVQGEVRVVLFREARMDGEVDLGGETGDIWEASACGGTHLPRAAQAAPVVVTGLEHIKGDLTRVTFMAGEEASERLSGVFRAAQRLARGLSVGLDRLPERVAAQGEALLALERGEKALRAALAAEHVRHADWRALSGGRLALLPLDDSAQLLPTLEALAAAGQDGDVLAVYAPDGRCGVASRWADHPAQLLLNAWLAPGGGRGGGRPALAQGRAPDPVSFGAQVLSWYAARNESQAQ